MISPLLADIPSVPRGRFAIREGSAWIHGIVEPVEGAGGGISNASLRIAEQLLSAVLGMDTSRIRVAPLQPSGRPVVIVDGAFTTACVSISHASGFVAAVVACEAAVGVDLVAPVDAGPGLDHFFSANERAAFVDESGEPRAKLWAAKESAYKAARLDCEFLPRRITVMRRVKNAFAWNVVDTHASAHGTGTFHRAGSLLMALSVCRSVAGQEIYESGSPRYREATACS